MSARSARVCVAESLENRMLLSVGDLDSSFSGDGIVTTDFNGGLDTAHAVAVQADGKVLVAGDVGLGQINPVSEIGVVRYNADGTLDDGDNDDSTPRDLFGTGGKFKFLEGVGTSVTAVAVQKDGKILLAGWAEPTGLGAVYGLVLRLNPNGTLDATFGVNGEATIKIAKTQVEINAMTLQSDGKIVVAGSTRAVAVTNNDFIVGRFNSNGTLDTSFNHTGTETTDLGGDDTAAGVALDNIGNIVVAGATGGSQIDVVRYEPNGTPDPNFGDNGEVTYTTLDDLIVGGLVIQASGIIMVANSIRVSTIWGGGIRTFKSDGEELGGGSLGNFKADSITLMPDGQAALGGTDLTNPQALMGIDTPSQSYTIFTDNTTGTAVAAGADGSIFVAGYIDSGGTTDFILAKFEGVDPTSWGSVSGNVFRDLDGDHVRDANEAGVSNVRVYVDQNKNGKFDLGNGEPSALTDSNGNFLIPDLAPGTYVIREVVPAANTQSLPLTLTYSVTITGGKTAKNINFANTPIVVPNTQTQLNGSVFYDWNSNGVRDISKPTEPDLAGETVFIDANKNGLLDKGEAHTTTDASGNYTLAPKKAGAMRIAVVVPKGMINTTPAFFDVTVAPHRQVSEHFGLTYADPDDTIAEAKKTAANLLKPGKAVAGVIANPIDVNMYAITVKAGQTVSFDEDLAKGSSLNAYLRLFDAQGHQLAANDNAAAPGEGAGIDSFLKFKFTTAGTYYIGVSDDLNTAYNPITGKGDIGGGTQGKYSLVIA